MDRQRFRSFGSSQRIQVGRASELWLNTASPRSVPLLIGGDRAAPLEQRPRRITKPASQNKNGFAKLPPQDILMKKVLTLVALAAALMLAGCSSTEDTK